MELVPLLQSVRLRPTSQQVHTSTVLQQPLTALTVLCDSRPLITQRVLDWCEAGPYR